MKQSAVEWLEEQYTKQITFLHREDFEQAKEMENQQQGYSEKEVLNLLTHFAVEIQRQNKKGQYPIEIKGWFERNKETFKNK